MYSEKMMQLFTINQLILNPKYDGELIVFDGKQFDLSDYVAKYRSKIKTPFTNSNHIEILCAYLLDNTTIKFNVKGKVVTLGDLITHYSNKPPVKRQAQDFIEKFSGLIYNSVEKHRCNPGEMSEGVFADTLVLDRLTEQDIKDTLSILFGLDSSRVLTTLTKESYNGNTLDYIPDIISKIGCITTPITSYANMIRCTGIPYSDYRLYISTGYLVSLTGRDDVQLIKDEYVYCCTITDFIKLTKNPELLDRWKKSFVKVFNPADLTPNKKLEWELPIR